MSLTANLPLPDKAGRGALEQRVNKLVADMLKAPDEHEFQHLSKLLDAARRDFHKLYNVKEHPSIAPLNPTP